MAKASVLVLPPIQITGPLASSEWLSQDSEANQYRSKAPMNQGKASVPWADTDKVRLRVRAWVCLYPQQLRTCLPDATRHPWPRALQIYDIKYFSRDTRHIGAVGGLNLSRTRVIVHQVLHSGHPVPLSRRARKTVGSFMCPNPSQKDAKGKDIPGGVDLDGPVPVAFGNVSTSLTMHSDLAPSGYTGEGQTASK